MTDTRRRSKTRDLSPLSLALATRLRMQAAKNNRTQSDLARITGINKKQVSLIWRGRQLMDGDQIAALFTAAGANPAEEYRLGLIAVRHPAVAEYADPPVSAGDVEPRPVTTTQHARTTQSAKA